MKLSFRQIDVPPPAPLRCTMTTWALDVLLAALLVALWLGYWFMTPGLPS